MRVLSANLAGLALLLASLILAGCNGESDGGGQLSALLTEWSVTASRDEGSAGDYMLEVVNNGSRQHQLVIIKSDLPPASLPAIDGRVDEEKVNIVFRLQPLSPGETRTVETELTAGKYVLICN